MTKMHQASLCVRGDVEVDTVRVIEDVDKTTIPSRQTIWEQASMPKSMQSSHMDKACIGVSKPENTLVKKGTQQCCHYQTYQVKCSDHMPVSKGLVEKASTMVVCRTTGQKLLMHPDVVTVDKVARWERDNDTSGEVVLNKEETLPERTLLPILFN